MELNDKLSFSFQTNHLIIQKIVEIEKFKGKWESLAIGDKDYLKELRELATLQSIGSSTRIEGSRLSDDEIKKLISNLTIHHLQTRDEQEVVGYWETLALIQNNATEIELSERFIHQLHSILLQYSDKDYSLRGQYKKNSNQVVATYPDGVQKIIFNTTAPHLVMPEMEKLLLWTNEQINRKDINSLLVIGTFIYEFLSIHPYHDGNGRLSRLLTTLLLVKEKYFFVQFVSFEHIIENRKKEYYQALIECQKNRYTENELIGEWLLFFLDCILSLTKQLDSKLMRIKQNDEYLNERQKQILKYIENKGKVRVKDIFDNAGSSALVTIKKDLRQMLNKKLIKKEGIGKATTYFM